MPPRNADSAYFIEEQNGRLAPNGQGLLNKFKLERRLYLDPFNPFGTSVKLDMSIPGRNYLDPYTVIDDKTTSINEGWET